MSPSEQVTVLNPFEKVRHLTQAIHKQVSERIVGQDDAIACLTAGLFIGGHVLMEGVPGLGKTLIAKTLSDAVALRFSRVQFVAALVVRLANRLYPGFASLRPLGNVLYVMPPYCIEPNELQMIYEQIIFTLEN